MSDDGKSAIVVIALLGNPFSPGYASARRRGPANALAFASMNVAVYSRGAAAWSLEERRVAESDREGTGITIGKSAMRWDGDRLVVSIDERTTPLGRPIRGTVVVHPEAETQRELAIDAERRHRWWPVAPLARIEVDLPMPGLRFSGHGYHDANAGDVPLEATFDRWTWSRARAPSGAILTYDVDCVSGVHLAHAFRLAANGAIDDIERTWSSPLPRTTWRLERQARVDEGHGARVLRSLEDGPFYARALVETRLGGTTVVAVHEELAAHRLRHGWVRLLTRCRMR